MNYQELRGAEVEQFAAQLASDANKLGRGRRPIHSSLVSNSIYEMMEKIESSIQREREKELNEIALMLQRCEMETSSGSARNAYLHAAHIVLAVDAPFKPIKLSRFNWPSLAVLGATFIVLGVVVYNIWHSHA
jgi:hypothetical protein